MRQLILHIPHSSTKIPVRAGYKLNNRLIKAEILKLTDWYTDDLFYSSEDINVIADFSRVFCDVERFSDDSQEEMSKFGMGVLYEKTDNGKTLRKVNTGLRDKILNTYYWPHHNRLTQEVENQLRIYSNAIIIDCHSFPDKPLNCSVNIDIERPDINIGIDSYHTPKELVDFTMDYFNKLGLKVWIDRPYSGTLVPLKFYKQNKNVRSIMIEINRKLYLKEPSNNKSNNYNEIKLQINMYLKKIKDRSY